jgi:hypothetical protein
MVVHLVIDVPSNLTKEEEELLRDLAARRGWHVAGKRGVLSKFR